MPFQVHDVVGHISMAYHNTAVTPVRKQWSYYSLNLSLVYLHLVDIYVATYTYRYVKLYVSWVYIKFSYRALYATLASYQIRKIAGCTCAGNVFSDPDMSHGTCVTHVPWCMTWLLTSGFLWSRRWEKRSRHSQRMRNLQFFVSGKRLISDIWLTCLCNCCDWLFYFIEKKRNKMHGFNWSNLS